MKTSTMRITKETPSPLLHVHTSFDISVFYEISACAQVTVGVYLGSKVTVTVANLIGKAWP